MKNSCNTVIGSPPVMEKPFKSITTIKSPLAPLCRSAHIRSARSTVYISKLREGASRRGVVGLDVVEIAIRGEVESLESITRTSKDANECRLFLWLSFV